MRSRLVVALLLASVTRAAFALTCGGFSIDPSPHVVVRYSAPLASGATHSTPAVSRNGFDVAVTRNISDGSSVDTACVDDTIDLGALTGGRYNVTWNDNSAFSAQRAQFSFVVGAVSSGYLVKTTMVPPGVPDQPVRLELMGLASTPPVAYVAGTNLNVVQYGTGGSSSSLYVLDFGPLPEARYDVTTRHFPGTDRADETFSFIVQQPAPSSACGQGMSVTRTYEGTTHLHYEESFPGYLPTFGPPTVTELITTEPSGWYSILVEQPVTDAADRTQPGAAPAQSVCHAEDIDLGVIPDGNYSFRWSDMVSVAGARAAAADWGSLSAFQWDRGSVLCTDKSTLLVPPVVIAGEPFRVVRAVLDDASDVSLNVARNGSVITVTEYLFHGGPLPVGPPGCFRPTATIDALPPGQYTLIWNDSAPPDPRLLNPHIETVSTTLTATAPTRQRAARH